MNGMFLVVAISMEFEIHLAIFPGFGSTASATLLDSAPSSPRLFPKVPSVFAVHRSH